MVDSFHEALHEDRAQYVLARWSEDRPIAASLGCLSNQVELTPSLGRDVVRLPFHALPND